MGLAVHGRGLLGLHPMHEAFAQTCSGRISRNEAREERISSLLSDTEGSRAPWVGSFLRCHEDHGLGFWAEGFERITTPTADRHYPVLACSSWLVASSL